MIDKVTITLKDGVRLTVEEITAQAQLMQRLKALMNASSNKKKLVQQHDKEFAWKVFDVWSSFGHLPHRYKSLVVDVLKRYRA